MRVVSNRLNKVPIYYEHPLNERIRTLVRLEDVFARAQTFLARESLADHQIALQILFELIEVSSRGDLKSDLLQELERQKLSLMAYRDYEGVDLKRLDNLVTSIDHTIQQALAQTGKVGAMIPDYEWLSGIKQRMALPGGSCSFDLPQLHYWLNLPPETRQANLTEWFAPFRPIQDGIGIILRLLRGTGQTTAQIAHNGSFNLMQNGAKTAQLLCIVPEEGMPCVPEVSANKYAISVRFLEAEGAARGKMYEKDVPFELTLYQR
ncbi:MAG: cell division protein ZapD [Burkholderiales bacterium]|jgi:cell division protein ZapD|nr:cell division protein ZapD [Burkholderiales bacterium]